MSKRCDDFDLDAFENVLNVALTCEAAMMTLTFRKGVPFGLSVFGTSVQCGPVFATCRVPQTIDAVSFRNFIFARLGEMGLSWDEAKRSVEITFEIRVTDSHNSTDGTEVEVGSRPASTCAA